MISRVPVMHIKEIITRWLNHILRTYHDMKAAYNLKKSYKEKFNLSRGGPSSSSPVRNEIKPA